MLSATPNKPVGTPLSPVYRVVTTQSRRSDAFFKAEVEHPDWGVFFFLGERKGYKTFTSPPKQNTHFSVFLPLVAKKHLSPLISKPSILASFLSFSGPLRRHVMLMEVYPDYLVSHPGSNYSN